MKIIVTIPFFLLCISTYGQTKALDTIYANDTKNVALFFPTPIRQGITGADHFVFTYNREKEQYFGLLQAKPGKQSNLLAITNDGEVYSYILRYATDLTELNYFIDGDESIGNERPKFEVTALPSKSNQVAIDRTAYFEKYSDYLLKTTLSHNAAKRKKGIALKLFKKVYKHSEVYLIMEIKNRSGIDFEIDYLNVYVANGSKKKKSSYQRLQQDVIYKHRMPSTIKNGQFQKLVFVMPKFVLGDDEKLQVELRELKGSRKIQLSR